MSLPTLKVQVAFTTNPTATPTYTDVSAYVRSVTVRRGRQRELDRTDAGTCQIVLANHDRRFDPTNSTGPYAPNVTAMKRVQVSCVHGGSTYWMFDGFADEWEQNYRDTKIAWTALRATDAFKIFSLMKLNKVYPKELSSDRVVRVLTDVGWSIIAGWETGNVWTLESSASQLGVNTYLGTGGWAVFSGQSSVQGSTLASQSALEHIFAVADAENGQFFMSAAGDAVFHDRHHRPTSTNDATYSDTGSTSVGYQSVVLSKDDGQLWNEIRLSIAGSTSESVVNDSTSQGKYYTRTYSKSDILITSTSEATDAAQWLLARYHEPATRAKSISFKMAGHSDTTSQADAILGREIGDRVTVIRTPPGGGTITQACFIEGIAHDIPELGRWVTSFTLSPSEGFSFWTLSGSTNSTAAYSTSSVLDATTILGY